MMMEFVQMQRLMPDIRRILTDSDLNIIDLG